MDGLVLVVGAGPTGLMAAANLARFGTRVRIIDRAVTPPDDRSRAAVVQPRTLEAFDNLGIADEAIRAGMLVDSLSMYSPSGRHATLTFAEPGWLDSPYDKLLALPQDQTERVLTELATRLGVAIERGVELTALTQSDDGVQVELRHAGGAIEHLDAAYVIGADGAHSTVRELSGLAFPGLTYRDEGLLGDIDVEWKLPHDRVSLCPRAAGFLLVFPLPGAGHYRVIMIVPNETLSEDRHLGLEEFTRKLQEMTPAGCGAGDGPPKILEARWLTRYRLHRRGVTSYQRGRVFVAGDAAHIHSPVGAQGMNTGIQDSYNLSWKLALVLRGDAPRWIIDTYDEERRHIGELLLNGTDRAFGFVAGHGLLSRTLRRIAPTLAARVINAPIFAKRLVRFVSQLEIKYPSSRLSVEGAHASSLGKHAPRAGDRAPDVAYRGSDGLARRLFDEFRDPKHVLLVFGDLPPDALAGYDNRVKVVAIDDAGVRARYGAGQGALYLIRPDGYIAFRGARSDAAELRADLERRFGRRP
jgi:2-polyprenyl-6-methoxyphenol hydroxylase-like FAD-dependent oxidoreductase